PRPHRRIPLPAYVFDREVYWVEPPKRTTDRVPPETDTPTRLPGKDWFHFPGWETVPALRDQFFRAEPVTIIQHGSAAEIRWMEKLAAAGIQFTACPGGAELAGSLAGLGSLHGDVAHY